MDEKTARKYRSLGKMPDEVSVEHCWRTREDAFEEVWAGVEEKLRINPGLEAKTLFEDLQRRYPGRFGDGQLRTLQRRVKIWRALEVLLGRYTFRRCTNLVSCASRILPR